MTRVVTPQATRAGWSSLLRGALIAAALALVINHLIRLIAVALLNPDPGFLALTSWGPVTMFTLLGVLGATIVYVIIRSFAANPGRVFTRVAFGVLLLSFLPNIALGLNPASAPLPGVTWPNIIALMLMHIPPALLSIRYLAGK